MNPASLASPNLASKVFMIKPKHFGFNHQTAETNAFQNKSASHDDIHIAAIDEFTKAVNLLRAKGIEVLVYESDDAEAPDAIFPNNWFSTHEDGTLVLYPMFAPNRRRERSLQAIDSIKSHCNTKHCIDLSASENTGTFLEGTGSIIFDHANQQAFASLSSRTNKELFESICNQLKYNPFSFDCVDPQGLPFYHTNVMLHIGNNYAVIYDEGIQDTNERKKIMDTLASSKKDIIRLSFEQVLSFCGNMIQLKNKQGTPFIVCSTTARNSLHREQIQLLEQHAELLVCNIPVIEKIGGGSIRCMIAELF
jgi:hypothetical protein